MAPIRNARHIFNEVPTGADPYPIPGRTVRYDADHTIDLDNVPLGGGILVKTLVLSLDSYMSTRMRDPSIVRSYNVGYQLGQPLENDGIGLVIRSDNAKFQAGDHIYGMLPFEEYSVQTKVEGHTKIENKHNLPWSMFLGAAGTPGQAAYCGWKEHAHAKKGEIVFISSGAGAVGSLVIQLAKRDGMKVIASTGSEEKVAFLKEVGADVAFNYKTTNISEILKKEGPIDVYWDNVGGETLDAALDGAALNARFIECGMMSQYYAEPYTLKNLAIIVWKQLKLSGIMLQALFPKYRDDFYAEVPALIASGELKPKENLTRGLERAGEAIVAVQKGTNTGKSVLVIDDQ